MKLSKPEMKNLILEIFPLLSTEDIDFFLEITTYKNVRKGKIITDKVNNPNQMFFILEGFVRGFITDDQGQEKTILLRNKGHFIGDIGRIFYNSPPKYTYEAIKDVHVLYLDYNQFESIALEKPILSMLLINILKEIILVQSSRIESMILMNAKNRYLSLIKNNPDFLKEVQAKHIANYIGITPVSLSRIQKEIKNSEL